MPPRYRTSQPERMKESSYFEQRSIPLVDADARSAALHGSLKHICYIYMCPQGKADCSCYGYMNGGGVHRKYHHSLNPLLNFPTVFSCNSAILHCPGSIRSMQANEVASGRIPSRERNCEWQANGRRKKKKYIFARPIGCQIKAGG